MSHSFQDSLENCDFFSIKETNLAAKPLFDILILF